MKTENVILALGGAALLVYFVSKQKDGENGADRVTIPGTDIGLNIPWDIKMPDLGGLAGLDVQGCPGLNMPDLSNFDLGLSDINWPDFSGLNLPTIPGLSDLGLPGLPGLPKLPGVNGDRKTWNPLWFLPDIAFDFPSISGLPSLPRLPGLPSLGDSPTWLDVLSKVTTFPFKLINPYLGLAVETTMKTGYAWVTGGTSIEASSESNTPFFVPKPAGAAPGTEPASVQGTPTEYPKQAQLPGGGPRDLYIL